MKIDSRIIDLIAFFTFYALFYKLAGLFYFGEPTEIPFTTVDAFWTFNPHWILIYVSSNFVLPLCYFLWFHKIRFDFLGSFAVLTITSCLIFIFYPTYIPRDEFMPDQMFILYEWLFKAVHTADGVTNCLPSLHVSTAFFVAWWSWEVHRKYFSLFVIYAVLVSISTMTVKQHYFYDAMAGFFLSLFVVVAWKFFARRTGQLSPQ